MNKNREKVEAITYCAIISALYVALSWISNVFGLASFAIQLRLSEALCVLGFFVPSASIGLFIGCLISNLTMGAMPLDIIFGSLATLIGAYLGSKIKNKYLVPLPTVLANTVIVPFVILFCYTAKPWSFGVYLFTTVGVFAGEMLSAYALGILLLLAIEKRNIFKR